MEIKNKSKVKIGVVPTHLMFVGALAPDEAGKLPRTRSGDLKIVSGMRLLCRTSPVKLNTVQVTLFPGTDAKDLQDMFKGLKALRLEVHLIMMVGGANPLNPEDEDAEWEIEEDPVKETDGTFTLPQRIEIIFAHEGQEEKRQIPLPSLLSGVPMF